MREWVLFGVAVAGFAAGAVGTWFGLAVKAALAPLQERVRVLEVKVTKLDDDRKELIRVMEKGFAELGDRVEVDLKRIEGRIDRALNGKGS